MASDLLDDLDDVLVKELVFLAHLLGVELHGSAPYHGVAELPDHVTMDTVAEAFDGGVHAGEDDGGFVVRVFAFGLSVNPDQVKVLPHFLHKFI